MPTQKTKSDLGSKYHRCEKSHHSESLRKDILLWGGAAAFVLMAHAAGAYILANMQSAGEVDGAPPAAIMVEFAELAVSPDAENIAPVVQEETATEIDAKTDAGEEHVETEQKPEIEPESETVPEALSETQPVEDLPEEQIIEEVVAENLQVVVPLPMKRPEVEKKPEQVAEASKKETLNPKQEAKKIKPKKNQAKPLVKDKKARASAAPTVAAESGKEFAASRNGAAAGNSGISSVKWSAKLQAHLERQKRFVQRRSGGRGSGVAQLSFVIDAGGNVLSARIVHSTGNKQLDQLALDMAKRASPVPAPPPAIAKPRLPIMVPIHFK